jgi:DNA topoisomerase-1
VKWKTLAHQGVAFPPEYAPRGFKIRILTQTIALNPEQEERAWAWAKKKDTPYVQDPVFQANFLKEFLALFPRELRNARLSEIDFSELNHAVDQEKMQAQDPVFRKERSAQRKEVREALKAKYGQAEVDGQKFDVANYMVEPPGLFIGRGDHPLRGKWKPRVYPRDVVLNLGKQAPVPEGEWKKVVHDHDSTWLARWIDKLTEKEKYVWLSDAATPRQQRDKAKYDKAVKLGENIDKVVDGIYRAMAARKVQQRTVATAAFLIYKLAMRVGDEKDADEADTVGASTLRVEHVRLNGQVSEFDFLGKDSVRWQKSMELAGRDSVVLENLSRFTSGKRPSDLLFTGITSTRVNEFFGGLQKGLTAKVFRTYLATDAVQKHLRSVDLKTLGDSEPRKVYHVKMANLQAAILCNHKRAVPKNFDETLEKKKTKLAELRAREPKTEKAAERQKLREEALQLQLQLAIDTKDYNLGTSLRNYIDPRVVKSWCDRAGLDYTKVYTKALQRKFMWVQTLAASEPEED